MLTGKAEIQCNRVSGNRSNYQQTQNIKEKCKVKYIFIQKVLHICLTMLLSIEAFKSVN